MKTKLLLIIIIVFAISCKSHSDKSYLILADSTRQAGDFQRTIFYLDTLIEMEPNNIIAYSMRGFAKGQLQDFSGALKDFDAFIQLDSSYSSVYDHRGICKKNLKDYNGALSDYNRAIALFSANGEAFCNRAVLKYYFLSDTIGACQDWEKSIAAGYNKARQIRKGKCRNLHANKFKDKSMSESEFMKFVIANKLSFTIPEGFTQTRVLPNGDMPYNFAIKLKNTEFEARYYIQSIVEINKTNSELIKSQNPNNSFIPLYLDWTGNVSENEPKILHFETSDVQKEFNANIGLYSSFTANSEYIGKYKYVHMMVFHKDDVADCFITFLWNEQSVWDENIEKVFHAMKFIQ